VANPSVPVEQAGEPIAIDLFGSSNSYVVPDSKRLEIDYVNRVVNIGNDAVPPTIVLTLTTFGYSFLGQHRLFTPGVYGVDETVEITIGPGKEVAARQPDNEPFSIVLSGHLVPT